MYERTVLTLEIIAISLMRNVVKFLSKPKFKYDQSSLQQNQSITIDKNQCKIA